MSILNRLLEDLKVIFLTKCKIRWVGKKWMEIMSIKGGGSPTLNGKFHFKFPFLFWGELPKLPQLSNSWPIICCHIITEFVFVIQLMNCLCLCSALAWRRAGTSRALQDQSAKKAAKSIVPAPIEGAASNLWIQFIWLLFVFYSRFQSSRLVLWHGTAQDIQ